MARSLDDAASKGVGVTGLVLGATALAGMSGLFGGRGLFGNMFGKGNCNDNCGYGYGYNNGCGYDNCGYGCGYGNCGYGHYHFGHCGPTAWEVSQKECNDVLALQAGIYEDRIYDLKGRFEDRQYLDNNLFRIEKEMDCLKADYRVLCAQKPLEAEIVDMKIKNAEYKAHHDLDWRTRYMITGEVVLPTEPVVSGLPARDCHNHFYNGTM